MKSFEEDDVVGAPNGWIGLSASIKKITALRGNKVC